VLVLNDLGTVSSPGFLEIDQAIFAGLQKSPYQIEFYQESLELTLFPDEVSQRRFREEFIRKYSDRKLDVIIAAGSDSLKFIAESDLRFLRDTPIIFCTILGKIPDGLSPGMHFTGVLGRLQPEETLNLALRLLPGTKQVVVTGGTGQFDYRWEAIAKQSFHKYESKLDFTYLTDLTMPTLLERLRNLPNHTIVYHTAMSQDAAGNRFIDSAQAVPLLASAANAPIFVVDDVDLRGGTVGGDLVNWADDARVAAGMAVRVLNGEKPQDIPIVTSNNVYMFDWRALRRWGVRESDLPPGSIVLNRQATFWQSFKWYIVGVLALIALETALICGLIWQWARRKKAESQLAITYDGLLLAVAAGKSVAWEWDIESGRNGWLGDLQTMFGIESNTYFGSAADFLRRVHPDDRDFVRKALDDARQRETPFVEGFRVLRLDGTVRWVRAMGTFYYARNGTAQRMLGMAVDITERRETDEKLYESQKRLAAIVNSAMDAIIAIDDDHRILLFNPAAERVFCCSAADAIGSSIDRFIPERFRSEYSKHISRPRKGDSISRIMGMPRLLLAVRANGEEFPIEASISQVEADGKRLLTAIIRDITDRLRSEEAARENEFRFELVANTAPVMIWMSGPDKLCTYFNQRWLAFTGRPLGAEIGNGWTEQVHPEDLNRCLNTYSKMSDRRESFTMQYRLRRHDGEYRWVSDVGMPRFDADGSFVGYIGSCIDVTDQKLAEEALADTGRRLIEAHEEERKWIARELHDDVNQRVALLSFELDRWSQQLTDSTRDLRNHIRHARQSLADISRDIQALSHRLHSSKLEYLGLVVAAKSFCAELAEQQKVLVDFSCSDVPDALPDEISLCLFRVLQEALQNAVKHSGAAQFKVELRGSAEEVRLTVIDFGIGFEWKNAMNRRGLGLISMRERLQSVKGEFSINSKRGRGTSVCARVPVVRCLSTHCLGS
jgi:PAS domain S-box-containing protein